MPYLIIAEDAPGMADLRAKTRPAHLAYLRANLDRLIAAGARLTDDGERATGSMYILDTDSRGVAEAFISADPYMSGGVFAGHTVTRWRQGVLDRRSFLK